VQHDDQQVKDYGVKLAINMIRKLVTNGINGINFCTLNLEKSVQLILEGIQWTIHHDDRHWNKLINVSTPHFTQWMCGANLLIPFALDGGPRTFTTRNRPNDIGP
jgi:methylenetetrahydrofolate reductase (NADPH)